MSSEATEAGELLGAWKDLPCKTRLHTSMAASKLMVFERVKVVEADLINKRGRDGVVQGESVASVIAIVGATGVAIFALTGALIGTSSMPKTSLIIDICSFVA